MDITALWKLCAEIRMQIYKEVFSGVTITATIAKYEYFPDDIPILKFTHSPQHSLNILRTCRALHNDAADEMWSTVIIKCRTVFIESDHQYDNQHYAKLSDLVRSIPPNIKLNIAHLRSVVLWPTWQYSNDDCLAAFPNLRTIELKDLQTSLKPLGRPLPVATLDGMPVSIPCTIQGSRRKIVLSREVPLHRTFYKFATKMNREENVQPREWLRRNYRLHTIWEQNPNLQFFSNGLVAEVTYEVPVPNSSSRLERYEMRCDKVVCWMLVFSLGFVHNCSNMACNTLMLTCRIQDGAFHYNSGTCWTQLLCGIPRDDWIEEAYSNILAISQGMASSTRGKRSVLVGQAVTGLKEDTKIMELWHQVVETCIRAELIWNE